MSFFGALVRTTVNVATLPVAIVRDVVMVIPDAADNKIAPATRTTLQRIKDEASD